MSRLKRRCTSLSAHSWRRHLIWHSFLSLCLQSVSQASQFKCVFLPLEFRHGVFSHHSEAGADRMRMQQVVMWVERRSSQSQAAYLSVRERIKASHQTCLSIFNRDCKALLADLQCWTVDSSFVFILPKSTRLPAVLTSYMRCNEIYYVITALQTNRCHSPCWQYIGLWNIVYLRYLLHVSLSCANIWAWEGEETVTLLPTHFLSGRLALCHVNEQTVLLFWHCREDCEVWDLATKSTSCCSGGKEVSEIWVIKRYQGQSRRRPQRGMRVLKRYKTKRQKELLSIKFRLFSKSQFARSVFVFSSVSLPFPLSLSWMVR